MEVLDQNNADQLLVRLCPNTLSEVTRPDLQEGYVPLSCLKAPPNKTFQLSKSSGDGDQGRWIGISMLISWKSNSPISINMCISIDGGNPMMIVYMTSLAMIFHTFYDTLQIYLS